MNDRIKLAEARGWTDTINGNDGQPWGIDPKAPPFDGSVQYMPHDQLPDPENDANDCEALIRWLNEQGWIVRISIGPDAADVWIETLANECHDWSGDDWKQGVCELALKVIDEKGQGTND